jgi:nicotinate-nucleotide adenylyltransferase
VLATEPVDELWFVPVHEHPLGKKMAAPFEHRVELCERAIADLGLRKARVSRLEAELGGEGRTVDLLEHLHKTRPGDRFALVLGTDLKAERSQWKRFDRIQELARIIEVSRSPFPVSSTQVRAALRAGGDLSHLVPRAVLDAIRAAGTYR